MTAPYVRRTLRDALLAAKMEAGAPTDATRTPGYQMPEMPTIGPQRPAPKLSPRGSTLSQALRGQAMDDTPLGMVNEMVNPIRQGAQAREMLGSAIQSLSRNRMGEGLGEGALAMAAMLPAVPKKLLRGIHYGPSRISEFNAEVADAIRASGGGYTKSASEPLFGRGSFNFWTEGGIPSGEATHALLDVGNPFVIERGAMLSPEQAKAIYDAANAVAKQDLWGGKLKGFGQAMRKQSVDVPTEDVYWTLRGGHLRGRLTGEEMARALQDAGYNSILHEANAYGNLPSSAREIMGKAAVVFDPSRIKVMPNAKP